ncbi:DedA family protein [Bordetella sp. FB-8]|uniref:DedA family protein n=1 Tax=Bordetella sp. FB-8 TaxID=1159870 RepID=UPI000360B54D|nr:DedA family protein [Bordetella sp. FB-8]
MSSLDWISSSIASYGYVALFAAAVLEGPIATVIGAFLASQGLLDLSGVYATVVLGDLAGDLLYYYAGRFGSMPGRRWGSVLSARRQRHLKTVQAHLSRHAGKTLLFGKLTHAAGFLVLLAAGAAQIPLPRFLGYNLLGTLLKSAAFVLLGYFAGAAYHRIDTYLWLASCGVIALIGIAAGVVLRRRYTPDLSET